MSGSAVKGVLQPATDEGWMVAVEAPDATLLAVGTRELPSGLALKSVDVEALKWTELRNFGITGPSCRTRSAVVVDR